LIPLTQSGCNVFTETFYLAFVAWREARSSKLPDEARLGVMFTLLNRVAHPKWWGSTVAECATKRLQYSSLTDPHDKQLTRWPVESDPSWFNCLALAERLVYGEVDNPVPGADSYFDDSISAPAWATPDKFVKRIGTLAFYNTDNDHEAVALTATAEPASSFDAELRAFLSAPVAP
jgi:hypothetical protein